MNVFREFLMVVVYNWFVVCSRFRLLEFNLYIQMCISVFVCGVVFNFSRFHSRACLA